MSKSILSNIVVFMNKIRSGKYQINISFIGYEPQEIDFELTKRKPDVKLNDIRMVANNEMLSEVKISEQKPIYENKIEGNSIFTFYLDEIYEQFPKWMEIETNYHMMYFKRKYEPDTVNGVTKVSIRKNKGSSNEYTWME